MFDSEVSVVSTFVSVRAERHVRASSPKPATALHSREFAKFVHSLLSPSHLVPARFDPSLLVPARAVLWQAWALQLAGAAKLPATSDPPLWLCHTEIELLYALWEQWKRVQREVDAWVATVDGFAQTSVTTACTLMFTRMQTSAIRAPFAFICGIDGLPASFSGCPSRL